MPVSYSSASTTFAFCVRVTLLSWGESSGLTPLVIHAHGLSYRRAIVATRCSLGFYATFRILALKPGLRGLHRPHLPAPAATARAPHAAGHRLERRVPPANSSEQMRGRAPAGICVHDALETAVAL